MGTAGLLLSDAGTRLAVDRTRLAYERTMMAWVRTSTSLISFGFTIHKFFQFRIGQGQAPPHRGLGPDEFGGLMVCMGVLVLGVATWDHRRSINTLRASYGPMPRSAAATIGALIFILGITALISMLFGL